MALSASMSEATDHRKVSKTYSNAAQSGKVGDGGYNSDGNEPVEVMGLKNG